MSLASAFPRPALVYEHWGLHPFAEPTPVGPGGSVGDCWAAEPLLAELASVEPESEWTPELEELVGCDWAPDRPLAWVTGALECTVAVRGEEMPARCDRCRRVVTARLVVAVVRAR